jgi:hypothetical protein
VSQFAAIFQANENLVPGRPGRHAALDDASEAAIIPSRPESFRIGKALRRKNPTPWTLHSSAR